MMEYPFTFERKTASGEFVLYDFDGKAIIAADPHRFADRAWFIESVFVDAWKDGKPRSIPAPPGIARALSDWLMEKHKDAISELWADTWPAA